MVMEAAQVELQQAKEEVKKTTAEIEKLQSETNKNNIMADLEDDKVEIQAANAVTGAEKARQAHEQNSIVREKNQIELKKISQGTTSK
jgi:hypothetical protein